MDLNLYVCILMINISYPEAIEQVTNKTVVINLDPPPLQGGYKDSILKGSRSLQ